MQQGPANSPVDLRELFRSELDGLYRYAAKLLRDPAEAEDAVQDAFIRICGRDAQDGAPRRPRPWMFRVLRNTCIDRLRHRSRLHVAFDDSVAGRDCAAQRTPETDLLTADALMHVARALDGLPADLAETLSLVVVEGLSYQDAAFVIGRPVGTVRSRLSRARRLLRHCLHGNEPGSAEPFRRESADMSADDA